ncbi:MAG: c-type cytochrome [Pseudomonadota bacterium]
MRTVAIAALTLVCACADKTAAPRPIAGADPERGLAVMEQAGCGACHDVPGLDWPRGTVGGPLAGFGSRTLIAGRFPNQPDVLVTWLRDAPSLSPTTGMPPMPITDAQARDVAAYLYTLDGR